ncbi:hypothetical protein SECTIM467_144 [Brevibacillus phage SecTim467]|uniref:Uncharacterized protein n=2 Tax=Jenstvirus jenst TaxID=1982225 RepID=A0A0K2CPH8_9CAUD|nr:hypothetical protein AVV11_gp052 [Brevibacillus phage Jenst]ALA07268.1 hypothetical protein JENST_139 [Brevibacillus phage Jenst]ALA07469.1 hypothetical protein SECTIM467_144 [Brevibacillus phage SecTim467]
MTTVVKGLNNILSGGVDFITFEEGKPMTLLFIDWNEDLIGIREHYEKALNPKYVRCPGKATCPLCKANPSKYPALRIKFRAYDPTDNKIKFVSLAKSHVQKLSSEFNLDEVDPTKQYVTIYRTGKGASDTSYSARRYVANPAMNKPDLALPDFDAIEMPDITPQVTPHTPDEIAGFMQALVSGMTAEQGQQGGFNQAPQGYMPPQGGYVPQQGLEQAAQGFGYVPQGGYEQVPQGFQQPTTPPQGAPTHQRQLPF